MFIEIIPNITKYNQAIQHKTMQYIYNITLYNI